MYIYVESELIRILFQFLKEVVEKSDEVNF